MIFAKTAPYGLDAQLKRLQTYLNAHLPWVGDLEVYGKIEPTLKDKAVIPEVYVSGVEYREMFVNDKVTATVGFIVKERDFENNKPFAKVDAVFTVNLKKAYATNLREDELCLIDAKEALKKSMLVGSIGKIKTGIVDVFNGFDKERIKHRDMQPWFVFSFEIEIMYNETKNC